MKCSAVGYGGRPADTMGRLYRLRVVAETTARNPRFTPIPIRSRGPSDPPAPIAISQPEISPAAVT